MKLQRNRNFLFQRFDQIFRTVGAQQTRHVFNADGISPHLYHFLGQPHKVLRFVIRTGSINQRALHVGPGLLACFKGSFQVSRIVERVKYTDNGDTVFHALFNELRHYVVRIMVVA